jgi:hypothetical protein
MSKGQRAAPGGFCFGGFVAGRRQGVSGIEAPAVRAGGRQSRLTVQKMAPKLKSCLVFPLSFIHRTNPAAPWVL